MLYLVRNFLLLALFFTGLVSAGEEIDKAKQLKQLKQRMQVVETTIRKSQRNKSKQQAELRKVEKKLGLASRKLNQVQAKLSKTKQTIKGLQKKQLLLLSDISQQKTLLAEQLRSAFLMGQQQQVKLLLNQQQPERFSRVMKYYEYVNKARVDNVQLLEKKVRDLVDVEVALKKQQFEQQQLVSTRKAESTKLFIAKKQRKKVLSTLQKEIKSAGSELRLLKENEKRLANLLRSIRQAINDIPILAQENKPFSQLKGKMRWPTTGKITKRFGSRKKSGRWDGVLIAVKEGRPVQSISHGRVVYADWLRGYGLLMIVDHGEGYMSLYAFNQGLYREVGDWVSSGEKIASSGLSGGQQNAGLYFSIRKNGKPVNPIHWCRATNKGRVG